MIETTVAPFVLEDGSQQQFDGASIICYPTHIELQSLFTVQLNVIDSVSSTVIAYGQMTVTNTEVDAETGTGTGEVAPWFSALQLAVKTKLAAIPDNSGVTFTVV